MGFLEIITATWPHRLVGTSWHIYGGTSKSYPYGTVNVYIAMEKIAMFIGKTSINGPFSIDYYQMVIYSVD